MFKKIIIPLILLTLVFLFVSFPSICINSAREGLLLWFHKVLPSLLPFMIVINIFVNLDSVKNASHLLTPFTNKLWNLPGVSFLVFILSLLSGYPMGARIIKELLSSGVLSKSEAEKTLCFSNNCGLIFIVATVGITLFNNISIGYYLLIVHILSAFIISLIWRPITLSDSSTIQACCESSNSHYSKKSLVSLFNESVTLSVDTITYVGGYIIFFSVISNLITKTPLFNNLFSIYSPSSQLLISGAVSGSLELSNGVNALSQVNLFYSLPIISAVFSFGGICVYCQTLHILSGSNLLLTPYLISKIIQSIISFILAIILSPYLLSLDPPDLSYSAIIFWISTFILVIIFSRIIITNNSNKYFKNDTL